jgi:hypothetical protein
MNRSWKLEEIQSPYFSVLLIAGALLVIGLAVNASGLLDILISPGAFLVFSVARLVSPISAWQSWADFSYPFFALAVSVLFWCALVLLAGWVYGRLKRSAV